MIKDIRNFEARVEPLKQTYYEIEIPGSNTTASKKKRAYDYYLCDNCGEKIIVSENRDKQIGGIVHIPIKSYKKMTLALCNKCLKPVLKAVNEAYGTNL